jgi:putative MFS transporter
MSTVDSPEGRHSVVDLYDQLNRAVDSIPIRSVHYKILALLAVGGLFNIIEQYNVAYAGPALADYFGLSNAQVGLLPTATYVSMAVGSLVTGYLSDRLGRKPILMANLAIFTAGALLAALTPDYGVLLAARVLVGVGLGGEMSLGFTTISEIMPTRRRGAMNATLSFLAGGLGVFVASGLAALFFGPLEGALGGPDVAWRWWFGLMFVPAVLLIFFRRFVPETPRFLLEHGRITETNRILTLLEANRLRENAGFAPKAFIAGTDGVAAGGRTERVGLRELFRPGLAKRTVLAWLLALAVYSGTAVLAIFMPTVLTSRGLNIGVSLAYTMITTFAGLVGALAGILVAHRLPRKAALICGGLLNAVLGIGFYVSSNLAIGLTCAAIMMCVFSILAAVVGVYFTELFPTRTRGLGNGSTWFVGLLAAGLGTYTAGALMDSFGSGGVFVAIALMCVVIAVVALLGPETRSRALDADEVAGVATAALRGENLAGGRSG